jgi:hypothetical protein
VIAVPTVPLIYGTKYPNPLVPVLSPVKDKRLPVPVEVDEVI